VAAYCEEAVIERTLAALLALDYTRYEVVVDDGSTDRTVELLRPYAADGRIRLLEKAPQRGQGVGYVRRDPDRARGGRHDRRRRHPAGAADAAPPRRPLPPRPRRRGGGQRAGHQQASPLATVRATPVALLGRRERTSHWKTERVVVEEESLVLAAG